MPNDPLATLGEDARALLHDARLARLATANGEGVPHAVPVCFAVVASRIYSVVDEKPKRTTRLVRLQNIEANEHVALVVDRYDEDWTQLAWVMIRGTATVLDGADAPDVRSDALAALRQKYPQYRAMDLKDRPLIEIRPTRVNAWRAEG